jgi:hypothetical protein
MIEIRHLPRRRNREVAQVGRLRVTCVPEAEEVLLLEELTCELLRFQMGQGCGVASALLWQGRGGRNRNFSQGAQSDG